MTTYWDQCFEAINSKTHDFSKSPASSEVVSFCDTYLKRGNWVLDLGCGGGRNTHFLVERGYNVVALDISLAGVRLVRSRMFRNSLYAHLVQGSLDQLPFSNETFSAIVCYAVIDHVPFEAARRAVKEMKRVKSHDGQILLTFDPETRQDEMEGEPEAMPDGSLIFRKGEHTGMLFRPYSDMEIKDVCKEVTIETLTRSEQGDRILICR